MFSSQLGFEHMRIIIVKLTTTDTGHDMCLMKRQLNLHNRIVNFTQSD